MSAFPKWADMTWLVLREGPGDEVVIPIAPTMKNIIFQGQRYFRMESSRASHEDHEGYGGSYLWDGWVVRRKGQVEELTLTDAIL